MNMDHPMYFSKRLLAKLARMRTAPVMLFEAGAGYGKTTAVRETLRDCPRAYWHCATSDDAQGNYAYLCRLIGQFDSAAARKLDELEFPNRSNARAIAAAIRAIDVAHDTFLVLDNFQNFLPALPQPVVVALVNPTCPRLHMIVLSHYLGAAQWHAEPQSTVYVGRDDLSLRQDEIAEFFAREGIPFTKAQMSALHGQTEGWIVAVALAVQNALEVGAIELSLDMEALLTAILWNRLDACEQDKLLTYSFFESLTHAQICEMEGTQALSSETRTLLGRLPLTRVDDARQRYELHQLLREYLRTRFDRTLRARAEAAARRAGAWCQAHGDTARAITCFYRVADYEGILSLDLVNLFLVRIDGMAFEDIAERIAAGASDEMCARHYISSLRLAYYLFGACRFEAYERLMARLRRIVEALNDTALLGEWTLMSAFSDFPDIAKMGEKYRQAASMIPGRSRAVSPQEPYMFGCPSMWVLFYAKIGAMEQIAEEFRRVLPIYTALTGGHGSGADEIYRGECLCVQGRFEEAELCAYKAMYQAEAARQVTISYAAAMLLGVITVYRGDDGALAKAANYIESRASAYPYMQNTPMNTCMLETVRGYLLGLLLETQRFPEWAKDSGDAGMNLTFVNFMIYQSQVTDLVLRKQYRQAIAKIEALLSTDSRLCSAAARNFMRIGLALCYLAIGHVGKAAEMLDQSLAFSAPDRNYTFIARFKKEFSVLFMHPGIASRHKKAIQEIRALRMNYAAPDERLGFGGMANMELPDKLTRREREVARLASDGMRNREIARYLCISEITVKSHMNSIFQKLHIDRRSKIIDLLK